ncbi:MAG: glycosyltransferase, partial [Planctomycetes bacterium]|nr:glycosyltransferase [Planctomycetota bacterium]
LCRLGRRARPVERRPFLRTLKDMLSHMRGLQYFSRRFNSPVLKIYSAALSSCFNHGDFACYFEPDNLAAECDGPTVTTVFDLSVFEHPQWHPPDRLARWRANWPRSSAATDHWIVASRFTQSRMTDLLSIPPEDITVIPLAGRPLRYPFGADLRRMAEQLGLPKKYFLYLGALQPRKNVTVLLDAYTALPGEIREACKLILAGPPTWASESFWRSLSEHPAAEHVLACGYVSNETAALLLSGATALLAPSR